jgi:hypothetical protein
MRPALDGVTRQTLIQVDPAPVIDGSTLLDAAGDPFRAGSDHLLGLGEHRLQVRFDHRGPGLRLRLGWTRPVRNGRPGGSSDLLSPRYLGRPAPAFLWLATDALALVPPSEIKSALEEAVAFCIGRVH